MPETRTPEEARIEIENQLRPGPGSWRPIIGDEADSIAYPQGSKARIMQEAVNILSRCPNPSALTGNVTTGLVVGYVQSGKTLSFTTVMALARDNGYQLMILVAGTSKVLLNQSRERLVNDLRLNHTSVSRPWRHIQDPTVAKRSHLAIKNVLDEWGDQTVPRSELKSVVITVMKNHKHLKNLIQVLQRISPSLETVPALIIDDEGDQAGLNTMIRSGAQSTTYSRLLELRATIRNGSYLQYTATPQAPLLINIVDILSPKFAEVITPGDGYVGGREFFSEPLELIKFIPEEEIPSNQNVLSSSPPSLLSALRTFLLGAGAHLVTGGQPPQRSMMVHPSQLTDEHGQYYEWVFSALENWKRILAQPPADVDRMTLIDEFQRDYDDLARTATDLPSFNDVQPRLLHVIRRTTIRTVNSLRTGRAPINWSETPYWILVGGQSMNRGFTLEGLTVTYMPRGQGVGNADSIQQRGRFFGYKRPYKGYCRIFLEREVTEVFEAYVEHEEDVRDQLIHHRDTGRSLSEWRREFFLSTRLRPTRNNVIDVDYWRPAYANKWVYAEGPHETNEVIQWNREVFSRFRENLGFEPYEGLDLRNTQYRNKVNRSLFLRDVHDRLLTQYMVRRIEDSRSFSPLLRQIQVYLNGHPDEPCTIILMSDWHEIRRDLVNGRIPELFQGRQVAQGADTYPGDQQVKDEDKITVQLRNLTLGPRQAPFVENVPHLAVWIPERIARDMVQQPQGGVA